MQAATHPALRQVIRRRAPLVRAGVKSLLSTHPHPAPARLSGAGLLPADALMRAEQRAAVCPGGGVGGRFFDGGDLHGANRRFFCPTEPHNSAQQGCGVLSGDEKKGL